MKKELVLLFFGSIVSSSFGAEAKSTPDVAPVKSKEVVEFLSKNNHQLLDLGKTDDFVGVLTRAGESSKDLRQVDLYTFKGIEDISMNKDLCEKMLTRIFGPLKESSLRYQGAEIFVSHTGKTCEAQFDDLDKEGMIPERRVVVGFINAKPIGLVFRLSQKSNDSVRKNIRAFWRSLR